jgi:hypothetical protein
MQRTFLKIAAIALLLSPAAYAQSLGDVARENREKKQSEDASAAPPKVITNKDLPKDPDANQGSPEAKSETDAAASGQAADRMAQRSAQQRAAEQRAAEQWKRQILAQKTRMAALQRRIDQLHASIQSAGGSVLYESPINQYQARQMERLAQMQLQLDDQKVKLDQMQEAARRAGMRAAVYDP